MKVCGLRKKFKPKDGYHDYDGMCAHGRQIQTSSSSPSDASRFVTFSVKVFKWRQRRQGKGLIPGKCIVRLRGAQRDKTLVFKEAELVCRLLDIGEYNDKRKVITVSR